MCTYESKWHVYTDTVPYSPGQKVTKKGKRPQAFKTENSFITHQSAICWWGSPHLGNSETQYTVEREIIKSTKIRSRRPKKVEVKLPAINNLSLNFLGYHLIPLSLT